MQSQNIKKEKDDILSAYALNRSQEIRVNFLLDLELTPGFIIFI